MTDRLLRERLGYLSDEFDEGIGAHLRSVSPHASHGSRSPRRSSRSPRPQVQQKTSQQDQPVRDSQPNVAPWPIPNSESADDDHPITKPTTTLSGLSLMGKVPVRGRETELKQKIQTLEDTVAEYERQKYNVMGTFSEYRERVAERERKLEAEYSTKIIALSEEVLGAKKDFEARMKSFQALQDKFEREKESALEKLRQEHQKEIQLLEQRFSESQLLNLEQKYMIEIQRLEEERKSLKAEKDRLGETFESKLRRAQTLYETELTAAKMLYSKELEALRDHEEALKEELMARQDEFHDRLQELQLQTKRSKEELSTCRHEVAALEKRLQQKEAEVVAIAKELEEARTETNQALQKLSKVEHELQETKQKYREQEEELQRKSNLLHIVETAKNKLEAVIKDLQTEVKALKNKVEFLEKERANLQSQSESQAKLQNSQVHALEAVRVVLESVTKEKETTKEHYEHLMEQERAQADERELAMKKEFGNKLNEIEEQYNGLRDHFDSNLVEERVSLRKKVEEDYEKRIATLHTENEALEGEVASLRAKLHAVLSGHEPSTVNFKEQTETMDRPSRQPDSLMTDLIAKSGRLNRELEEARNELDERQQTIRELQEKCKNCNLSEQHKDELAEIREQIRSELEAQNGSADAAQIAEFKNEITSLREKIAELENVDKASSSKTADELQETIKSLNATIEELNARIESLSGGEKVEESEKSQMKEDLQSARAQLDQHNQEHEIKVNELLEQIDAKQKRIEALEVREVELRDEIERELRSKFAEAAAENHVADVEGFEKQLQDYKEHADAKEKEQDERIKSLTEESGAKDEQIEALHNRVKTLMVEVGSIQAELEKKTNELRNFGKKTDDKREQQQTHALEKKMENLQSEHEQAIAQLQQRETELMQELDSLKEQEKKPVQSAEVQTVDMSDEQEQQQQTAQCVTELEQQLKAKDELIEKLRRELIEHCCDSADADADSNTEGRRKDRSQSLAVVPDDKFRRRAANKFQCLVNQMTKSPDKKTTSKSVEKLNVVSPSAAAKPPATPSRDKSPAAARSKSPSFLARMRDRSPAKARSPAISEQSTASSSKNLLSPTDAERPASIEERRRSSPARPLFSRKPTGSEKRPAWKM